MLADAEHLIAAWHARQALRMLFGDRRRLGPRYWFLWMCCPAFLRTTCDVDPRMRDWHPRPRLPA